MDFMCLKAGLKAARLGGSCVLQLPYASLPLKNPSPRAPGNIAQRFSSFVPQRASTMSLSKKITTPNGQKYEQPLGLFINGELVPSVGRKTIASIDPA